MACSIQRMAERGRALYFLGAALCRASPGVELRTAASGEWGFSYTFSFRDSSLPPELSLLEELLSTLDRQSQELRLQEMVPFSGSEYLKSLGQPHRAKRALKEEGPLLKILSIEGHSDLIHDFSSRELGEVSLYKVEEGEGSQEWKIVGEVFPDRETKRQFMRLLPLRRKRDWRRTSRERGLLLPLPNEEIVWLSKGVEVKERLRRAWREVARALSLEEVETPAHLSLEEGHLLLYRLVGSNQKGSFGVAEARWVEGQRSYRDLFTIIDCRQEVGRKCTSFLRGMKKVAKLLGLDLRFILFASKKAEARTFIKSHFDELHVEEVEGSGTHAILRAMAQDDLGREWELSSLSLAPFEGLNRKEAKEEANWLLQLTWFASGWERLVTRLIEHREGVFPLWLAPEVARLFPCSDKHRESVRALIDSLCASLGGNWVHMDEERGTLAQRMGRSSKERIPMVGVIGDREMCEGTIQIRRWGSEEILCYPLEEWRQEMVQECCRRWESDD